MVAKNEKVEFTVDGYFEEFDGSHYLFQYQNETLFDRKAPFKINLKYP